MWRKGLKLSGESMVEKITLDGVRGLRKTLSATVHDVLYYMSPIYCQDIIDSVSSQLNRLYLKFLKRNPGYDGKVSIYGHSLGSVLSYDILCHQENLSSPFPMDFMYKKEEGDGERDGESPNVSKLPSECNPQADETEASQDTLDDAKLGRQTVGFCSISPSVEEENSVDLDNDIKDESNINDSPSTDCVQVGFKETCQDNVVQSRLSENVPKKDLPSSDTVDKDKLLSDLKSEVESLKAKVAELEEEVCNHSTRVCQEERPGISDKDRSDNSSSERDDVPKGYKPFIRYTKLEFKVDTFFAVGSPLGVFLALRNVRIGIGEGREYWEEENIHEEMPACQRMFNIFHPFDPVAYRVEPLVCKEYVNKRPVIVPYHKGGKRLYIALQDFAEDLAVRSQTIVNHLNSVKVKVLTICQPGKESDEEDVQKDTDKVRSYGSYMMERLTGSENGRIDHVLQDKTFQHPYISAIKSHTNYWRDHDTALFILKHLYQDIREESKAFGSRYASEVGNLEERLPLTFSDDDKLVTTFFKKARTSDKTSW